MTNSRKSGVKLPAVPAGEQPMLPPKNSKTFSLPGTSAAIKRAAGNYSTVTDLARFRG